MRPVEGVIRERDEDVPDSLDCALGVAVGPHPGRERLELGVQDLLLLLAHGLAQQVRLAHRVPGQLLRDEQHLLLIDDQAVGVVQDVGQRLGQLRVDRHDRLAPGLAVRVVVVRVGAHRARPVQRVDGGDVLEPVRPHRPQQRPHRAALELEHPERVAAGEQVIGGLVVERQGLQVDRDALVRLDAGQRVVQDRQVAQAEEVHLEQPEVLAARVVELGDDRAVCLPLPDRDVVEQRLLAHDHAGRVHAGLPDQSLQPAGGLQHLLDLGLGLVQGPDLARLAVPGWSASKMPGQRDVLAHHRRRERLGDPVAERVGEAEHPGRVLDRRLGLDRAVGDDLGDPVIAVLLGHVPDHVAAPALVEVDVDVRHRHALGVEEPLEHQAERDRVQVGDAHRVGDDRAGGRAAARADPDPVALGPHDEVGDDEEVAAEPHLLDDAHLVLGPLAPLVVVAAGEPAVHPGPDFLAEPAQLGLAVGQREVGHQVRFAERHVGALGDQQRVVAARTARRRPR